jgi:hypothetical protein
MRPYMSIKIILCVVLIAILSSSHLFIFADDGINHDEGEYDVSTGDGESDWKYWTGGRGVRISIYFVEGGEENFSKDTKQVKSEENEETAEVPVQVYQIGKPTDFAKYNPYYTVDVYTRRSVFDYMNKSGKPYKPILTVDEPYKCIVDQSKSITKSMPDPKTCTTEEWTEWFTGGNYKNIPEISRLCGEEISSSDFENGIYSYKGLNLEGTYKIFFEPLVSAEINGNGMYLTLRDAIRYNEYETKRKPEETKNYYEFKIIDKLNPMFVYLANRAFLVRDEKDALNMTANNYINGRPYLT